MIDSVYKDGNYRIKVLSKKGKLYNCVRWFKGEKIEVTYTKTELETKELIC